MTLLLGAHQKADTRMDAYSSKFDRKMAEDMELQEAKDAVFELMKEKDKIEASLKEMKAILDYNHVGMDDELLDSSGYPRPDIDVFQVRTARREIIYLRNDHKAIMKKIEDGLHKVHSLAADNTPPRTYYDEPCINKEPFLRVKSVTAESPAANAGIEVDDLILSFGTIDYSNFRSLQDIDALVKNSVNKFVFITIRRGPNIHRLTVVPHPWNGKGLLGCHVVPIETVER